MSGSDELHAGGGRRPFGGSQCIRRVALELEEDSEEEALREEEEALQRRRDDEDADADRRKRDFDTLCLILHFHQSVPKRALITGRGGLSKARERRCTQCAACEASRLELQCKTRAKLIPAEEEKCGGYGQYLSVFSSTANKTWNSKASSSLMAPNT
ncbi:hypothetical protein HaLaN_30379 [Haematococcus lacustris]|uniref:Uncharacterized protein n=1 Tax=Haematococcus lacustris TaxID=44745 RepID=A0A6A0AGE8_HAELA|nr:hypothetical protein HaLaN_30379 [Haematococcus lacustris]